MNSNDDIIKQLNDLKEEFLSNLYKDKDKSNEIRDKIKQVLQDAPDGTEMYRVVQDTSSGWTSHGSYSDTRAVMKTLKKDNGVWEMYGRKRDTLEDASASIVYNDGKLMNKADAQAELEKQKVNDTSSHRDIVNVGTDKWGNPVGQSTNRVEYPNKKDENMSSVDWEEEHFDLIWDEYVKQKAKELGVSEDEVPEWGEDGFDWELFGKIADDIRGSGSWMPDPDMYMESKKATTMSKEDIMQCYISDIKDVAYNYAPHIRQQEIDNILNDLKGDKDLDDVDKKFILKMVKPTLYDRDIKLDENKEINNYSIDNIVKDAYYDLQLGDVREFKYDDHITFEIYKDTKYEDVFQIYTYLDNDLQYGFNTEEGVLYNDMKDELTNIVSELIGGNK